MRVLNLIGISCLYSDKLHGIVTVLWEGTLLYVGIVHIYINISRYILHIKLYISNYMYVVNVAF